MTPGDTIAVHLPSSRWADRRNLVGKIRSVRVLAGGRARILDENGRSLGTVDYAVAGIYRDTTTGEDRTPTLWASVTVLKQRSTEPFPLPNPEHYTQDPPGYLTSNLVCHCGGRFYCGHCAEELILVPSPNRSDWLAVTLASNLATCQGRHDQQQLPWQRSMPHTPARCTQAGPHHPQIAVPECCDWPMALLPQAWTCRIDRDHHRAYMLPHHS